MKVALVGDSNVLFMPYQNNYTTILDATKIEYTRITWDRFQYEDEPSDLKYRDSKIGHKRGVVDYLRYVRFVKRELIKGEYDHIIVYGVPIAFFMGCFLKHKFRNRYILDIRDHHKLLSYFKIDTVIRNAAYTVISSPQYMNWLPKYDRYLINHNMRFDNLDGMHIYKAMRDVVCKVSYIGATRDYKINIELINALKNSCHVIVNFHGAGEIDEDIARYVKTNNIDNVVMTGRYTRLEEPDLYFNSDLINVLRFPDGINNETALPNRLYSAAYYGKPMLAFKGTYLDQIISEYNLGLVITTFEKMEQQIYTYMNSFDVSKYDAGRSEYLLGAIKENDEFKEKILEFCAR